MEFQAVIMAAGTGSRMREIASTTPKCLLPVGNIPLIMCSINIFKKAGFVDIIVFVRETEKSKIQNTVEDSTDVKLDFVSIPKHEDWGTADSLRFIKDKIKSHIIVLSCDLMSDFSLQNMINFHICHSSDLTLLLVPFPKSLQDADMPGLKKKFKFERDIIGLDPDGKLTFINSEADFEENVPLKLHVLEKSSEIKVHSNLMDAHVYIINHDLFNYLIRNEHISTLKGEFLPSAVNYQFDNKRKIKTEACDSALTGILNDDWIDLKKLAFDLSSSLKSSMYSKDKEEILCFAYVDKECMCMRINTLVAYADINKKVAKNGCLLLNPQSKSHQFPKSQVDGDSMIGENCELLTKSSIKQTVLGNNCKLSEKTKINNSVIMDNVVFGKECSIQGSVICSNVSIEDNCSLKNCIIGPDQIIKTHAKLNSEILQGSEQLLQI